LNFLLNSVFDLPASALTLSHRREVGAGFIPAYSSWLPRGRGLTPPYILAFN
jgi:putative exporter of polyketide antibiotics